MSHKARSILVAGNWKMNHGPAAAAAFFEELSRLGFPSAQARESLTRGILEASLLVPAVTLSAAREALARHEWQNLISIGAQNAHFEKSGAYTGELSGPLLQEIGIDRVLVGHSERRQLFGETDESAGLRMASLLEQGFSVIFCLGETRAERESGQTEAVLARQLEGAFRAASQWREKSPGASPERAGGCDSSFTRLTLAYEPVWAIGTGLTASPEQAQEAHARIRDWLNSQPARVLGAPRAETTRLLYGGSVTPENFSTLLACPDVDGGLVGGASLKPESFLKLIEAGAHAI